MGAAIWGIWFWTCRVRWVREDVQPTGRNTPLKWKGIRDRMRRGYFWHDDMVSIRFLGDTESIELIMRRLPESGNVNKCLGSNGPAHAASALRALTAHDAGNTAEGWREWWRTHQGKSQYALICESFAPLGIDLRKKPTKEGILELLRLVGVGSAPVGAGPKPDFRLLDEARAINALRILRDREVKPESVTHADLLGPEGEAIFRGLVKYSGFMEQHPVVNGVGVVFGDHAGDIYIDYRDDPFYQELASTKGFFGTRWAPWAWYGGVAALLAIGGLGSRALWTSARNLSRTLVKFEENA